MERRQSCDDRGMVGACGKQLVARRRGVAECIHSGKRRVGRRPACKSMAVSQTVAQLMTMAWHGSAMRSAGRRGALHWLWIWSLTDPSRLAPKVRASIDDPDYDGFPRSVWGKTAKLQDATLMTADARLIAAPMRSSASADLPS
jgi:hypothetical protein